MLVLEYVLLAGALATFAAALGMMGYDLCQALEHRRRVLAGQMEAVPTRPIRWRRARKIALLDCRIEELPN